MPPKESSGTAVNCPIEVISQRAVARGVSENHLKKLCHLESLGRSGRAITDEGAWPDLRYWQFSDSSPYHVLREAKPTGSPVQSLLWTTCWCPVAILIFVDRQASLASMRSMRALESENRHLRGTVQLSKSRKSGWVRRRVFIQK